MGCDVIKLAFKKGSPFHYSFIATADHLILVTHSEHWRIYRYSSAQQFPFQKNKIKVFRM